MPDPDPVTEPRTFTQDDVTAAAAEAASKAERRAKQAATADLATKLGIDNLDDAAAIIAAARAAEEANTSEIDKARKAQTEAEAAAAQAIARAATIEAQATATTALLAANLSPSYIADAIRLIDVTAEDMGAEIAALADRMPALFAPDTGPAAPKLPTGVTPPKPPAGTGGGLSAKERAAERFKPRHKSPVSA